MSQFVIYWLNSLPEVMEGESINQAFATAGYGAGAVNVVDWYEEVM